MIKIKYNVITSECTLETFDTLTEAKAKKKEYERNGINADIRMIQDDITLENYNG